MHFLRKSEVYGVTALGRPWACVKVKLSGRDVLEIQEGISVGKADSQWVKLPERVKVVGPDGKQVKPSKGKCFWVTVETFDPFHMVTEGDEYNPAPAKSS